ncbi:hypothetical protein ACH9L7_14170 [Haloferax sp. S1W]|uniref:hypothetical protein n=1 Tax=Haloferax sp. S1W TaxID=3377110 RepID=UPI0037C65AD1
MAAPRGDEGWLYHLPAFLDRVRERGAHSVRENLDVPVGGVVYHHRGARVPAYNATFVWSEEGETFDLELDTVGDRAAWFRFDAAREWDFFLARAPGDAPCLAWMTDEEFRAEEADQFEDKAASVSLMRFSFGLYLQSPDIWPDVEAQAHETDAPCFVYRPGGRTLVPQGDLAAYESVLPPELFGGEAPAYFGVVDAHLEVE